jgi:hypothetical protein
MDNELGENQMPDAKIEVTSLLEQSLASKDQNNLKRSIFDLSKLCQTVPQNDFLVRTVAGPLFEAVHLIFDNLSLIVPLTERRRRQVLFAIVARSEHDKEFAEVQRDKGRRLEFLTSLICDPSEVLIARWYGECPNMFTQVLAKIGDEALPGPAYNRLFEICRNSKTIAQTIVSSVACGSLNESMLDVLLQLPRSALAPKVAVRFESKDQFSRFMDAYSQAVGDRSLKIEHMRRLANGEGLHHFLEDLLLSVPFPDPILREDAFEHVQTGHDLTKMSKIFSNCSRTLFDYALNGEYQFYVWRLSGEEPVLFSIVSAGALGWRLAECAHAGNIQLESDRKAKLMKILESNGIRCGLSYGYLLQKFRDNGG